MQATCTSHCSRCGSSEFWPDLPCTHNLDFWEFVESFNFLPLAAAMCGVNELACAEWVLCSDIWLGQGVAGCPVWMALLT